MNTVLKSLVAIALLFLSIQTQELKQPEVPPLKLKEPILEVKPETKEKTLPPLRLSKNSEPLPAAHVVSEADFAVSVITRLFEAIKEANSVEIISLDPHEPTQSTDGEMGPSEKFHAYRVLGRKILTDKEVAEKLVSNIGMAIARGPDETKECFDPRHGMRIKGPNRQIDVLICYTCLNGELYENGSMMPFSTTDDPEKEFDEIFAQLGLKKAD